MDFECHDDCNVVAKKTAAEEHVIIIMDAVWLDHVNCSVVSEQLYLCAIWLKSTLYKHVHAMTISILLCLILLCLF